MSNYHSRRSPAEWLHLINECRTSGLTDAIWCERNSIPLGTFYNAVSRLRKKACDIPESLHVAEKAYALDLTSPQDVVRVDIFPDNIPDTIRLPPSAAEPKTHLDNSHTIELCMNGVLVKLSNAADAGLLTAVLQFLQQMPC